MRRLWIASLMIMWLANTAAAQAPGPAPVVASFLEQRVAQELASEGVLLARSKLALKIEQLTDKWLVSLVDLATGRVAASTVVEALPSDREAAVASMTHVVADLATQVAGREPPVTKPVATEPPPSPSAQPIDVRTERDRQEVSELTYRRQQIKFGRGGDRDWRSFRGELEQAIEPADFYRLVNRPDLLDSYQTRRRVVIGGLVVVAVAGAIAIVTGIEAPDERGCGPGPDFNACDANNSKHRLDEAIAASSGAVVILAMCVSTYFIINPQPIDEGDAKSLADAYNQHLRRQLGLPVVGAQRAPLLQDMRLAPYVTGRDAGLAISGRF
jgi:hypothetical protein